MRMIVAEHVQAAGSRVLLYAYLVLGINQEAVPLRFTPRRFEGQERLRAFRITTQAFQRHDLCDFLAVAILVPEQDSAAFARVVVRAVPTYRLDLLMSHL